LAIVFAVLAMPPLVFFARAPVLVVTDAPFAALYGPSRMKREQAASSLALFRRVKPVLAADGAGPDILVVAISSAASRPFCVLFPRHLASAAERYHEQFPEIPAVLLGGFAPAPNLPVPDGFLCVYETDRDADLYRAGLFAGLLGDPRHGQAPAARRTFALWQDIAVTAAQRDLFIIGARERHPESGVIFANSAAEMPDEGSLSCAVLTGAGAEYLERRPRIPVVLFSWLDPAITSREVAVLFDDSPWGLAVPAARMAANRQAEGKIPSKPLILSANLADSSIFRALRRAARRMP
jgi:hypothetical protein